MLMKRKSMRKPSFKARMERFESRIYLAADFAVLASDALLNESQLAGEYGDAVAQDASSAEGVDITSEDVVSNPDTVDTTFVDPPPSEHVEEKPADAESSSPGGDTSQLGAVRGNEGSTKNNSQEISWQLVVPPAASESRGKQAGLMDSAVESVARDTVRSQNDQLLPLSTFPDVSGKAFGDRLGSRIEPRESPREKTIEFQRFSSIESDHLPIFGISSRPIWVNPSSFLVNGGPDVRQGNSIERESSGTQYRYFVEHRELSDGLKETLRDTFSDQSIAQAFEQFERVQGLPPKVDIGFHSRDRGAGFVDFGSSSPVLLVSAFATSDPATSIHLDTSNHEASSFKFLKELGLAIVPSSSEGSLQRSLGVILAGILVSVQHGSRNLERKIDEENALHPRGNSTFGNSSNSQH